MGLLMNLRTFATTAAALAILGTSMSAASAEPGDDGTLIGTEQYAAGYWRLGPGERPTDTTRDWSYIGAALPIACSEIIGDTGRHSAYASEVVPSGQDHWLTAATETSTVPATLYSTTGLQAVLAAGYQGRCGIYSTYNGMDSAVMDSFPTPDQIMASGQEARALLGLQPAQSYTANAARSDIASAYAATQLAAWYFGEGHDVMAEFFTVASDGSVGYSDLMLSYIAPGEGIPSRWGDSPDGGHPLSVEFAKHLIEVGLQAQAAEAKMPTISLGTATRTSDGSADYPATITAPTDGTYAVTLAMADGTAVPSGVALVDSAGNPVTVASNGHAVHVRVGAGVKAAALKGLTVVASASGTTAGAPTLWDAKAEITSQGDLNGVYDRTVVSAGVSPTPTTLVAKAPLTLLADTTPTPITPVSPASTPSTTPVQTPADPARTGTSDQLAVTGSDTLLLGGGALILAIVGTGLVIARRRSA